MGKRKEINRDQVSEGKRRLSDAIDRASVDAVRDALLFLSTTALACEVPNEERDCDTTTGGCRKSLNINVDLHFQVRVSRHFEVFLSDSGPCEVTHFTPLFAALGPDPVHTEMVRCLLTPQTLRVSKDSTNYSSIGTVVDIATNAREMIWHKICCEWEEPITPLEVAMEYGNITLVRLLLEHRADPNQKTDVTPLVLACQGDIENEIEIAKLLLEYGADPNDCTNDGLTPVVRMSRIGNLKTVKLLLLPEAAVNNNTNASNDDNDCTNTNKTNTNKTNTNTNNSINYHYCFHKNRWGTNVFHYDQQSMNALMHACAENHEDVVRFLANGGSNAAAVAIYVNDYRVDPALWYASAHGSATIVRFLMDECGARASYRKDPAIYSSTPLEEASQWGHVSTVKALLERSGSDPRTSSGQKARTQAERSGHSEVVELLDVWRDRLDCIEDSSTTFPLGFLPLLLSRSNDSAHRILCNHAGSLFCCRNQKVCVDK
jgi:ankyrin repeat protein